MLALSLLFACGQDSSAPPADSAQNVTVTYWRDVRPVLDRTCARCHTERGQALSFDDPASVQALATSIATVTAAGTMPPPAPDPTCRDYVGSEALTLSADDRATLRSWADAGAPLGNEADAPAAWVAPTIAPFDATMIGEGAYQPNFAGTGNDYRCFVLDVGNPTRTWVNGFEPLVDNAAIVHHIVLWSVEADWAPPAPADAQPGFPCDGFGQGGWSFFAGWAPGGQAVRFDEGVGMPLRRDARFVLQMHYYDAFPGAENEFDQSGYGLTFADSVEREVFQLPLGVEDFTIPADRADHEEAMVVPWPERYGEVTILGSFPHMHLRGSSFEFNLRHPDTSTTCVTRVPRWDFHNQQSVVLLEPVTVGPGDVIDLRCRYDNSGNPEPVEWGERTDQEMCYGFTYGYAGGPIAR